MAEELDEARETIIQLREALRVRGDLLFDGLDFSPQEAAVLELLLETPGCCVHGRMADLLDLMSESETMHTSRFLSVIIHRLRAKLTEVDVVISSVYGRGFTISDAGKARMNALRRGV